jgi:hypothetical protein
MNAVRKEAPERHDIEALLPWHAAGTLNRRDAQMVEQALASDQELRKQYDLVREELAETIRLNESLGAPSAKAMEKLFSAIDAEPARRHVSLGLGARITQFVAGFSPRTLAYAGTAAAIALVLQAGVITGVVLQPRGQDYGVASHGPVSSASGPMALVRFTPGATAADITQFLQANQVKVVDGPSTDGTYTVRATAADASRDELVRRMQADRLVNLVLPK